MQSRYILLIVVASLSVLAVGFWIGNVVFASNGTPAIRIGQGDILLEGGNITLGDITLWNRGGCLATRHFTTLGEGSEAGYLRIAHGLTPTGDHANQSGFLQIYAKSDDLLYLMDSIGVEQQIVNLSPDGTLHISANGNLNVSGNFFVNGTLNPDDVVHIISNNAAIKLEDDSGNYARIKVGNSQLTFEADPDNAVVSTDIVFKMDGNEVARFQQGGQFQSLDSIIAKEGFATQLWDVSGANWETALVNTEYYSPNQYGGIYGTVYRQYFTTTIPSTLTSGSNVARLVDYYVFFKYAAGTSRGAAIGSTASVTDNQVYILLSGGSGNGNLSWDVTDYTVIDGWVDYTKP